MGLLRLISQNTFSKGKVGSASHKSNIDRHHNFGEGASHNKLIPDTPNPSKHQYEQAGEYD